MRQLLVQMEDNRRALIDVSEVLTVITKKSPKSDRGNSDSEAPRN